MWFYLLFKYKITIEIKENNIRNYLGIYYFATCSLEIWNSVAKLFLVLRSTKSLCTSLKIRRFGSLNWLMTSKIMADVPKTWAKNHPNMVK